MLKNYYLANACRTMGMLLRSHFSIVRATQVTATTTSNLIYRQELSALASDLTGGRTISARLEQRADLFPPMVTEMIAIGEKTGTISDTLLYLASYYEQEVEAITKNLASSLEPMLMVMMGLIVGFVAVSVITPIYAITQNIHR
jgi:type II secretory pathway component PulF